MSDQKTAIITFAGHEMLLDAGRALYWPAHGLLIVSDLHFGKGTFLSRHGSPLPIHDTYDTLQRLSAVIARYQPQRVIALGDSFHDLRAYQSLTRQDRHDLHALIAGVSQWDWVLGNHDPQIEDDLPGDFHKVIEQDGVLFSHERDDSSVPQVIGHFHPKAMMRIGGRRVCGPSFMISQHLLIMPAFGSYTGGLDCADPAIAELMDDTPECRFIYNDKIWKL